PSRLHRPRRGSRGGAARAAPVLRAEMAGHRREPPLDRRNRRRDPQAHRPAPRRRDVIVLASQSKARRTILAAAGIDAVAEPAMLDEAEIKQRVRAAGGDAATCALTLAEAKAAHGSRQNNDALV